MDTQLFASALSTPVIPVGYVGNDSLIAVSGGLGTSPFADSWIELYQDCLAQFEIELQENHYDQLRFLAGGFTALLQDAALRVGVDFLDDNWASFVIDDSRLTVMLGNGSEVDLEWLSRGLSLWQEMSRVRAKAWATLIPLSLPIYPRLLPGQLCEITVSGCTLHSLTSDPVSIC